MERVDDTELYEIAKRTLGIPPNKEHAIVPKGYLQELRTHVDYIKNDTNFRVFPQPGYGYGVVQCLEKGCGYISIPLIKNKNQDINEGIGSLSAFRIHATRPIHVSARAGRIQASEQTLASTVPKPGVASSQTMSANHHKPVVTTPAIKQESTETEGVSFMQKISHPKKVSKRAHRSSAPKIKVELSPDIEFDLRPPHFSNPPPMTKQEESPSSSGKLSNKEQVSSVPVKRASPSYDEDNMVLKTNSSSALPKKIKKDSSLDHKPLSLGLHHPLSQLDRNVQAPLATDGYVPTPVIPTDFSDINMGMKNESLIKMPAPGSSRALYGDVRDFTDDEDYHGFAVNSNGLNDFIVQAGNAEIFDGNASVDIALERLGLRKIGEHLPFMTVPLLPHQLIGICWMLEHERSHHKGGILADEMGLGKTIQMIATMIQHRSDDPAVKSTLICAPVALLDQWKLEIEMKTGDHLSCLIYHGPKKTKSLKELQKYDVIITTYGTLSSEWPDDPKKKQKKKTSDDDFITTDNETQKAVRKRGPLMRMKWFRVVLDEAQCIRNKQTRASNVVTELDSAHRWCLTGTPVINTLTDCYSQFRFLKIRPWHEWSDFREHIACYERRSPNLATTRLQAILNTCLLRRKKDTMLDGKRLIELPPKEIRLEHLVFSKEERDIYDSIEKKSQIIFNRYLRAGTVLKNYTHVLVLLLRLRQVCGHPALVQENADVFLRPEDDLIVKEEDQSEIHRATILAGKEYVEKMQRTRKEIMRERIATEKASLDATIEEEDCPICFDVINTPVITLCGHSFCKECLELVMSQPAVVNEEAQERRYASTERPCPTCRSAVQKEMIFQRSAFEPNNAEFNGEGSQTNPMIVGSDVDSDDDDGMPIDPDVMLVKKENQSDDEEESTGKITTTNARSRKKPRRRSYADLESDYEDDYDDDDDSFIVHTDEDEDEDEDEDDHTRRRSSKRQRNVVLSDSEDDGVLLPPKVVRRRTRKVKGERRKFLPSTKLKKMMELLKLWAENKQTENEKTMVVSQWTSCLDLAADYLDEHGFTYVRYQGDMTRVQREKTVRTFMANGKARVLLMSLKGGGVGLNLTRANHVISLDLGWSPAVEQQAFDRVHRLGQTRGVTIDRLVIRDTVEARILALQERKQNLMDGSLGEGGAIKLNRLSVRDLANLFGVRA